jgi:hypothetical protein
MEDLRLKALQIISQEEIFRAIAYGALKARASRLGPGEIIKISRFEMVVAEDEDSDGTVVQIIETREEIDALVLARTKELGIAVENWSDRERRKWTDSILGELANVLRKWQDIEMHYGPGENLTFERAIL